MKAIYETRIEMSASLSAEYKTWLFAHAEAIVKAAGFDKAEVFTLETDDPAVAIWVVHYVASTRQVIEEYLNIHSKHFRADSANRFGANTKIQRGILIHQPA